jgi:hypothetical protein
MELALMNEIVDLATTPDCAPNSLHKKLKQITKIKAIFKHLPLYRQAYLLILLSGFLYTFALITGADFKQKLNSNELELYNIVSSAIIPLLALGLLLEGIKKHKPFLTKIFISISLGIVSVFSYQYGEMKANLFINQYVGVDPSYLPLASSLLTALYTIEGNVIALLFFVGVFFIFYLFLMFTEQKGINIVGLHIPRIIGIGTLIALAASIPDIFSTKNETMDSLTKEAILLKEFYNKSHCLNVISEKDKIATLDKSKIIIYRAEAEIGKSFEITKCISL